MLGEEEESATLPRRCNSICLMRVSATTVAEPEVEERGGWRQCQLFGGEWWEATLGEVAVAAGEAATGETLPAEERGLRAPDRRQLLLRSQRRRALALSGEAAWRRFGGCDAAMTAATSLGR